MDISLELVNCWPTVMYFIPEKRGLMWSKMQFMYKNNLLIHDRSLKNNPGPFTHRLRESRLYKQVLHFIQLLKTSIPGSGPGRGSW